MIEERQFLNFIPPKLSGDTVEEKRRYMIVSKNEDNKTIEMINISKISGKNIRNLIKNYNVKFDQHYPLKLPSFAKTNTVYKMEYFEELENYISFNGAKLNTKDFNNILKAREQYVNTTNKNDVIYFTKKEFLQRNQIMCNKI